MCGICGIINLNQEKAVSADILLRMREALIHRGPDDAGEFIDNNVGLAMRRLKIIDLDTGHQPVHNEDKTIWLVLNGEIYNYLELKGDLLAKGHKFYSRSDTEVIVHLYEEYGLDCVGRLNGMFAFALWDISNKQLLIGRDRMGQKPLYYTFKDGQFIFASEIKSLFKHPLPGKGLDFDALNEYLAFEYIPAPRSIYKDIKKLPAAHLLVLKNGQMDIRRYWNIKFDPLNISSDNEASERLFDILNAAMKRHLISDVPLGVFLSGGIDSSAIAALAKRASGQAPKTFSIAFNDQSFDESGFASLVARYIGSEHHQMRFDAGDCLKIIPQIYDIIDEPLADASILPTYILSKFARQHVTVALGGDGSDELFAGYPTHHAHEFADNFYLKIPFLLRGKIIEPLTGFLSTSFDNFSLDFKIKKFISGVVLSPEIRHQVWMGAFSDTQKRSLFTSAFKGKINDLAEYAPMFENLKELSVRDRQDPRLSILAADQRLYLQDDILTKVDRASMANSLEVRAPFLDNQVIDFANGLDFAQKFNHSRGKVILRKMLLRNRLLPRQIIVRKKKGFGIPIAGWINNELKDNIREVLSEENIKKEGFFNYPYIKKILDEHAGMKKNNRKLIWTIFMFELWRRKNGG